MNIKKKKGGEGGANWMDTYGDMVTLLLCFFVLLYSMSTIDEKKWQMIVMSFNLFQQRASPRDRSAAPAAAAHQATSRQSIRWKKS